MGDKGQQASTVAAGSGPRHRTRTQAHELPGQTGFPSFSSTSECPSLGHVDRDVTDCCPLKTMFSGGFSHSERQLKQPSPLPGHLELRPKISLGPGKRLHGTWPWRPRKSCLVTSAHSHFPSRTQGILEVQSMGAEASRIRGHTAARPWSPHLTH